jgi:hypothetical protein
VTDVLAGLRSLVDHPASAPHDLDDLRRRVARRARRRAQRRLAAAVVVAVACVAVLPLVRGAGDRPTQVATAPAPATAQAGAKLEYAAPDGWDTLFVDADQLVVATRPLSERDIQLALLVRADVAFTALPADAVVVVVGFDPLEAKYGANWDGTAIPPSPAYALGPERTLPDSVRFRRGDVPQSIESIGSYAGPAAPADRLREAEAIAASVRLVKAGGPSADVAAAPVPSGKLTPVARVDAGDVALVMEAADDCAVVRPGDRQSAAGQDRLGGGCAARPAGSAIAVAGPAVQIWGRPGSAPSTVALFRVGAGVQAVSARTADGRSFPAVVGAGGWGLALVPGRVAVLTALDGAGRQVAEAFAR